MNRENLKKILKNYTIIAIAVYVCFLVMVDFLHIAKTSADLGILISLSLVISITIFYKNRKKQLDRKLLDNKDNHNM